MDLGFLLIASSFFAIGFWCGWKLSQKFTKGKK